MVYKDDDILVGMKMNEFVRDFVGGLAPWQVTRHLAETRYLDTHSAVRAYKHSALREIPTDRQNKTFIALIITCTSQQDGLVAPRTRRFSHLQIGIGGDNTSIVRRLL